MKKHGPAGDDPQQHTDPGPTSEEFVRAYSELRIEILEEIRARLEEYFRSRPVPHRMNREARKVAEAAYEAASGVAEFRIRLRTSMLEVSGA